ncbi:MAG TPA: biotin/lipoyl-containing protein [Gemmatimonadales bacterium]|nr:biotin/lipoyl-containing protein [Gemmatimonadales bacterium]
MKYTVRVGTQTVEVEVAGTRVLVDGEPLEAHLATVPGTPLHHLILDGACWTVATAPGEGPPRTVVAAGERFTVEVEDERSRRLQPLAGAGRRAPAGGVVVVAPMPGLVVRVEVSEGQRVEAGAGLVVMEAMKMENELRASRAGTVARVHVVAGQAVERGEPLVTLESSELPR